MSSLVRKRLTRSTHVILVGQRFNTPAELRKREGGIDKIIRHAVKGMLPKGPLGRSLMDNLYVYEGTEHKHEAQKPKAIDINQYK